MSYPTGQGPATAEAVKRHLRITDDADDATIGDAVAAVNVRVLDWRCGAAADGAASWDDPRLAALRHGAVMLAARLWRRRDTPEGVAAFAGDGALYVQRNDPDVALLLGLGAHGKPAIG